MGKADLPRGNRLCALIESFQLLANTDPVGGGPAAHVAGGLEAGDGAVEALLVVLVGLGELGGQEGELDLVSVDAQPAADELLEDLGAGLGCKSPLPTFHTHIIRTFVCQRPVKERIILKGNQVPTQRSAPTSPQSGEASSPKQPLPTTGPTPTPSSQALSWEEKRGPHPALRADLPAQRGGKFSQAPLPTTGPTPTPSSQALSW